MIVLLASMIVMILGVSALLAIRVRTHHARLNHDLAHARLHARTGVEMALFMMHDDPDWRNHQPNGTWLAKQPIGDGTYSIDVIDPDDGDLDDDPDQPVLITATGEHGEARYRLAVRAAPEGLPGMDGLEAALHAAGDLMNEGDVLNTAPLSTNHVLTNEDIIRGDAHYVDQLNNTGDIIGETLQIEPHDMPDPLALFDHYQSIAKIIPYALLPGGKIEKQLLSPQVNPFTNVTNERGVYYIDCHGQPIEIVQSRIVGTLVLANVGPGSAIKEQVVWEPAESALPALIVDGDLTIENEEELDEDDAEINFNPPGTPYMGEADTDMLDLYASEIRGLCYVSGKLTIKAESSFTGVLIAGGAAVCEDRPDLMHDAAIMANPPPGFRKLFRPMFLVSGSWEQVVD